MFNINDLFFKEVCLIDINYFEGLRLLQKETSGENPRWRRYRYAINNCVLVVHTRQTPNSTEAITKINIE